MASESTSENQISFFHELLRKATHMGALIIPGGYIFFRLEKSEMLTIMVPAAILMIVIDISRLRQWHFWTSFARKIGGSLIRHHEMEGDFTGATYILVSVCLTVALYSKSIAIAALTFIIVGDTCAAIIGRKFGRHRFYRSKTVEGSLGCLVGTLVAALAMSIIMPDIHLAVMIVGAVVATIIEAFPLGVDDNISVPLVSGLAMTLITGTAIFL